MAVSSSSLSSPSLSSPSSSPDRKRRHSGRDKGTSKMRRKHKHQTKRRRRHDSLSSSYSSYSSDSSSESDYSTGGSLDSEDEVSGRSRKHKSSSRSKKVKDKERSKRHRHKHSKSKMKELYWCLYFVLPTFDWLFDIGAGVCNRVTLALNCLAGCFFLTWAFWQREHYIESTGGEMQQSCSTLKVSRA